MHHMTFKVFFSFKTGYIWLGSIGHKTLQGYPTSRVDMTREVCSSPQHHGGENGQLALDMDQTQTIC